MLFWEVDPVFLIGKEQTFYVVVGKKQICVCSTRAYLFCRGKKGNPVLKASAVV